MTSDKYIGMHVHKEAISIAVMNSAGKLLMECIIETKAITILQFFAGLRGAPPVGGGNRCGARLLHGHPRVAMGSTSRNVERRSAPAPAGWPHADRVDADRRLGAPARPASATIHAEMATPGRGLRGRSAWADGTSRRVLERGEWEPFCPTSALACSKHQKCRTDEAKTYKPDPLAYQLATDAWRLKREEIAFAALAGWDAAGAMPAALLATYQRGTHSDAQGTPSQQRKRQCYCYKQKIALISLRHSSEGLRSADRMGLAMDATLEMKFTSGCFYPPVKGRVVSLFGSHDHL
jgi:hypothetical protein